MVLRESSQWFWNFINKTIHHVDWFERSSPSSTYLRAPWPTRSLWRLTTCKNKLKLTIKIWLGISVTRWLDYLFHIWPFTKMKCCPIPFKFCQKGSKFCQILNEPFQNWYSFLCCAKVAKFCQAWSHCFGCQNSRRCCQTTPTLTWRGPRSKLTF